MNVQNLKRHFNSQDARPSSVEALRLQFSNPESRPIPAVARTQIPVARFGQRPPTSPHGSDLLTNGHSVTSPTSNGNYTTQLSPTPTPDRWRLKYEEAEKRRKTLLSQNQKLSRDHEEMLRKQSQLQREMDLTRKELSDRETQLNQLRKLSEAVYKEYDQLKNQFELETGTMQKAMQRASMWYKENRELKRRSTFLMQRMMQFAPEGVADLPADDTDSGHGTDTDDFEELRKTVQDLNQDVARLQAEVNAARLQEFEAQETIMDLTAQLDEERRSRSNLEGELKELRTMRDNLGQVSRLVAAEVTSLREQCEREKETAQRMRQDADKAKKERNVLAHQSQLLMCDVAADQRLMQVVLEVENLKRSLEEEQQRHAAEIQALQEKLDERDGEAQLELLEEKLKLAEAELQCALQRAERAENMTEQLSDKVSNLEEKLEKTSKAPPPPPPPPLPPPPPPMPLLTPATVTLRRRPSCDGAEAPVPSSAVLEMANLLGISRKNTNTPPVPGAIDDIINQIKGGRFSLRSTEPKPKPAKVDEQPPVVQEMINVLGTLRKRRTPSMRRQLDKAPADIHL
ncbi:shootin-1-like isoform X1 [Macrosteles quadrilineatus]|uniref:shootin-1-like isoform X1 n=1 Tax=Macrosteles quadrilineatus TaxID=74068 RepID=UPI0023E2650A|nr:shootin-1-like isoform X1 [Macrosteles quadrilineatus]